MLAVDVLLDFFQCNVKFSFLNGDIILKYSDLKPETFSQFFGRIKHDHAWKMAHLMVCHSYQVDHVT